MKKPIKGFVKFQVTIEPYLDFKESLGKVMRFGVRIIKDKKVIERSVAMPFDFMKSQFDYAFDLAKHELERYITSLETKEKKK